MRVASAFNISRRGAPGADLYNEPGARLAARMQKSDRRKDLDCAKGLGILLVVLGHLVSHSSSLPAGNLWYMYLRAMLYEFHMPFFMYLSGYVTFLSGAAATAPAAWAGLVRRRATRLLLPFLIFGLLIIAGKWAAAQVMHVDNMPASVGQALFGLVWRTDESAALSVWYVAVLFILCIVTPPLLWLTRARLWPVAALALLLYFTPVPHVMYLDRVATYYVFFLAGGLAVRAEARWLGFIDRWLVATLALFLIVVWLFVRPLTDGLGAPLKMLIAGLLSMAALHGLVRRPAWLNSRLLLQCGVFSFVIYLLNTPCIGLVKGALLKFIPWDGPTFIVYAVLLMLGGTLGPILIKKYLFRHVPFIDRVTT